MKENSNMQKVCSFYVSNMHFATMILPFVNKQMEDRTKVITFFESNFSANIELVLSRLTVSEERKKELLNINWKDTNTNNYFNIEKILKNQFKNEKSIVIVNGTEEYINIINSYIEKFLEKSSKKININSVKIINFYEVGNFNENIMEILDMHDKIFNTSGEHEIEDIFEGYKKKQETVNI